jgi:HK97 family phage portal protein
MTGVTNKDSQFLEARRFTAEQIAAMFRVPLYRLNDLTRATFSNVEHQGIDYVRGSLRLWLERLEQSMNRDLLSAEEQAAGYYFAFNVDAILRGDYTTRMQGYAVGIQNGFLTPNEARAFEDLPPKDGGDQLLLPMNARPGGVASVNPNTDPGPAKAPEPQPTDDEKETPDAEQ